MQIIVLQQRFGSFLADGGKAVVFLAEEIEPVLQTGDVVVLDFEGVENMTDSFANGCFANLFERHPEVIKEKRVLLRHCSPVVQSFIRSAHRMAKRSSAQV